MSREPQACPTAYCAPTEPVLEEQWANPIAFRVEQPVAAYSSPRTADHDVGGYRQDRGKDACEGKPGLQAVQCDDCPNRVRRFTVRRASCPHY